ncbi:hypothetical protein AQBE111736_12170 [Aquirufa beregesia]
MMKHLKFLFLGCLMLLMNGVALANSKTDWKEKDQFHTVMSQTFHPAEEGNLKPIRERSEEMLSKALAWQKSPIPTAFKKQKDIQVQLDKLVKGTQSIRNKIQQGAKDEEIKADLTALHDIFHEIVGLCKE